MKFFARMAIICLCVLSAGCAGIRYGDQVVDVSDLPPGEEVTSRVWPKPRNGEIPG